MVKWVAMGLLVGILAAAAHADELSPANACDQAASWQQWQALLDKHPDDPGLQTLHALRIGLCVKVQRGELSVQQGTDIFEQARLALVREWQEAAQRESPDPLHP
jgi:hypothetical protein